MCIARLDRRLSKMERGRFSEVDTKGLATRTVCEYLSNV